MPDAEIPLFTTAFRAIGYLFMMAIVVCYFAGSLAESILKRQNIYRRITFQLGLWFSVLLPFTIHGRSFDPGTIAASDIVARQLFTSSNHRVV